MATDFNYVHEELLSEDRTVAVCVLEDGRGVAKSQVVKHVLANGHELKEVKAKKEDSNSKNAIRMREMSKDSEYRRRENERRRE